MRQSTATCSGASDRFMKLALGLCKSGPLEFDVQPSMSLVTGVHGFLSYEKLYAVGNYIQTGEE